MKNDPAINVVWEVRHRISESVNHDLKKLIQYYQQLQQRHWKRLASQIKKANGKRYAESES